MSNSSITVNNKKLATDQITEDNQTKEVQRVRIEGSAATANGVDPGDIIYTLLNIKGGSSKDMNVSGTLGTPVIFECLIPTGKVAVINRMVFRIMDNATPSISEFGAINNGITNGLVIRVVDTDRTTVLGTFTADTEIKTNGDFTFLAGGSDVVFFIGTGNDAVVVRWSLDKGLGGKGLTITAGQAIEVLVRDDLTSLVSFKTSMQGTIKDA